MEYDLKKEKKIKHKTRPKWYYSLRRQRISIAIMVLLQFAFFVYIIISGSRLSETVSICLSAISILVAIYIIAKRDKEAYKLTWVFMILAMPIFGGLFYLLFKIQTSKGRTNKSFQKFTQNSRQLYEGASNVIPELAKTEPDEATSAEYIQSTAHYPLYNNTDTTYFSSGEEWFEDLKFELSRAEKYIFMEYFIINEGIFWNTLLEILKKKASEGIEIRIIYDDVGCFLTLPKNYVKILAEYGIKAISFNKFRPIITGLQNNRDHRKICVIDGRIAYTGGSNIADEYINAYERFGHWKDDAIKLCGEGAVSFCAIFLEMWDACRNDTENVKKFLPDKTDVIRKDLGYVQPYADSPLDTENVSEHIYLRMIYNAKKYIYINTPYLIIDGSMCSALMLAAKSGVDVRIITPEIYDKYFVSLVTKSFCRELLDAGVKIYEYKGGFNHAKSFISDDICATVGTANLDYRSLYLHFECGVRLVQCPSISDIKKNYMDTLSISKEMSREDYKANIFIRLLQNLLRIFAPLM